MKKLKFLWIIVISILIIISGFILYFSGSILLYLVDYNSHISDISSDLANFAIFNNYFLGLISLILLGYISFITYRTTNNFYNIQLRPLVFATLDKPERIQKNHNNLSWYVVNGAKSPALNLIVRFSKDPHRYTKWVACTSLAEKQRLELFWVRPALKIEICYSDVTEENFYFYEYQDLSGKTKKIEKSEYMTYWEEAKKNGDNNLVRIYEKYMRYITEADPFKNYFDRFIKPNLL